MNELGVEKMPVNPDELKERLEKDENAWMKIQGQMNNHKADVYNQIGDLFRLVRGLTAKLEKQEKKIKDLDKKLEG